MDMKTQLPERKIMTHLKVLWGFWRSSLEPEAEIAKE
jgi:hypothetical protein